MAGALGVLLLLGAWQIGFVIQAISSNVMLNGTIIGVFVLGVVLVFRGVLQMRNEELAFAALKEMYLDARTIKCGNVTDPLWRHYRCNELAVVYKRPEVLGQAFQFLSEKFSHGKDLSVDPGTLSTLVESIQIRLDDRKSMTNYVAGILVLLGLIGTFIGLMVTLSSIGTIIGGIDLSGEDPTAAVSGLMTSLQVPLKGMATGFSSSLFGLVTSLTLGLMVRFSGSAFSGFTFEFESWLSNIVEVGVENEETEGLPGASSGVVEQRQLALILRTARVTVSSNAKLNEKMERLIGAVEALSNHSLDQTHALENLLNGTNELQQNGRILAHATRKTLENMHMMAASLSAKDEIVEATISLANQLETRDSHLVGSIQALDTQLQKLRQRDAAHVRHPGPEQQDIYTLLKELKDSLRSGDMGGINDRLWSNEEAPDIGAENGVMPEDGCQKSPVAGSDRS